MVGICGLGLCGSGYAAVACSCEHGNEPLSSVKGGKFLDQLCDYEFLKIIFILGVS
jgi:hypothetical protein